ncbi:hypothetical protein AYO41_01680 [Verrucomicrobia bacterium SCGC AG-212-E04]|nr:hypothetical protein AYO41_01680 [Verrucomicrobia bacterium SCGC AG-212-E04]
MPAPHFAPNNGLKRFHPGWVAAILCLGLQLWNLSVLSSSPFLPPDRGDLRYYLDWATRIAAGTWTDGKAFFGLPLYAYVLAGILRLTDGSLFVPLIIQATASATISFLVADFAILILANKQDGSLKNDTNVDLEKIAAIAGIAAGLGWAFFPPGQALTLALMPTILGVLGFWLVVRYVLSVSKMPGMTAAAGVGVGIGFAAMMVANILALVPLVALRFWTVRAADQPAWWSVRAGAALIAGIVLGLSPAWAHNYFVADENVVLSAHGGINFYVGNQAGATGYPKMPPGMRASQSGMMEDSQLLAEQARGRTLTRAEAGAYWAEEARDFIRRQPLTWLQLLVRKIRNYWNVFQYDDVGLIQNFRDAMIIAPGPRFGWIAALGLPGLLLASRSRSAARWIGAAILLHLISLLPVFITERYRMVAIPGLLAVAVAGLVLGVELLATQRWAAWLKWYLLPLGASLWLVTRPTTDPKLWALDRYSAGRLLLDHGKKEEATKQASAALAFAPDNPEINFLLGNCWLAQGDRPQAKNYYRRTLALQPSHGGALNNAGVLALEEGYWDLAKELFGRAAAVNPREPKVRYLQAQTMYNRREWSEALEAINAALALQPDQPQFRMLKSQIDEQLKSSPPRSTPE